MSKRILFLFFLFSFSYLAYHFFSLPLNPIPWFDEVFFASMSKNFLEAGTLIPEVSKETFKGQQVFVYGPVHFLLEGASFRFCGFGIWQYRCITLLFGCITVLTTAALFRLYYPSSSYYWLLILLFALDPFLNLSMHEGRMDLVTIAFMLLSIYFLLKGVRDEGSRNFFFSGFFCVVSVLTTPRIGIIAVPVAIALLFMLEGKNMKTALWKIVLWVFPIVVLYVWWMLYAFGGITELIRYYQKVEDTGGDYLGGRGYIPKHEYLLIGTTIISIVIGIYKKRGSYFNTLTVISLSSIFLFYLAVVDWGPYSVIILPFYYFLLMHGLAEETFHLKNLKWYPVILLFVFNLGYFSIKAIQVIAEKENRDYHAADLFIKTHIPEGSKVIGDGQYYYSVVRAHSSFRIYDQYLSVEQREQILREEYDFDYVIITDRSKERDPEMIRLIVKNNELKKVAERKLQPSEWSKRISSFGIVSDAERSAYNAEVFVRVKKYESPVAIKHE